MRFYTSISASIYIAALLQTGAFAQKGQADETLFNLTQSSYNSAITALDETLRRPSISQVISGSGTSKKHTSTASDSLQDTTWYKTAFTWSKDNPSDDAGDTDWEPEGITLSSDAGYSDNSTDMMVSWVGTRSKTTIQNYGVRVSFIGKPDSGGNREYAHALLVEPYMDKDGNPNFRALSSGASGFQRGGGLVWRGSFLYITDELLGFRVFDLDHIYQVSVGEKDEIGRDSTSGAYYGGGAPYVIPQARTYTSAWNKTIEFSPHALSLDRNSTPPALVVSEIRDEPNEAIDTVYNTLTVRWQLDDDTNLLKTNKGVATAIWAWRNNLKEVSGITYVSTGRNAGADFVVTNGGSSQTGIRSDIYKWVPGAYANEYHDQLPPNAKNVAYRPDTEELWMVGGQPNQRYVMALDVGSRSSTAPPGATASSSGSVSNSTSSAMPTTTAEPAKNGLSKGAVAGIAVGIIALVVGLLAVAVFIIRRKRRETMRKRIAAHQAEKGDACAPSKPELDSGSHSKEILQPKMILKDDAPAAVAPAEAGGTPQAAEAPDTPHTPQAPPSAGSDGSSGRIATHTETAVLSPVSPVTRHELDSGPIPAAELDTPTSAPRYELPATNYKQ